MSRMSRSGHLCNVVPVVQSGNPEQWPVNTSGARCKLASAKINGIEAHYQSFGEGETIVFAHGAGGNLLSWCVDSGAARGPRSPRAASHDPTGRTSVRPRLGPVKPGGSERAPVARTGSGRPIPHGPGGRSREPVHTRARTAPCRVP